MERNTALALVSALCYSVSALHSRESLKWQSLEELDDTAFSDVASGLGPEEWLRLTADAPDVQRQRVAVLTGGTLVRYFVNSTVKGLIEPLVKEGHTVDYYLALNVEYFQAWKYYAQHYVVDASILGNESNATFVANLVNETVRAAGGTLRHFVLHPHMILLTDVVKNFARHATGWHAGMAEHSLAARSNVLKLIKMIEELWGRVLEVEAVHGRYDLVITLKDDSFWVKPFSLNRLLRSQNESIGNNASMEAQVYHQKCSDSDGSTYDAGRDGGYTEYILILKREVAEPFTTMYSRLLSNETFWSMHNLEVFVKTLADEQHIIFQQMPAAIIPMQRGGRIWTGNSTVTCIHKACDSSTPTVPLLRPFDHWPHCAALFRSGLSPPR